MHQFISRLTDTLADIVHYTMALSRLLAADLSACNNIAACNLQPFMSVCVNAYVQPSFLGRTTDHELSYIRLRRESLKILATIAD